ncbi:hypothetical protein [Trueperella abortisuis]|uniref:hypothetical protein n=1 Tax=Trueperella abortisuis TaxID=445930 RepID=UPI002892E2A7|nr:hypothetical protein [Trueperella abortisuis]
MAVQNQPLELTVIRATRCGQLPCQSITIRKAGDPGKDEPRFIEMATMAAVGRLYLAVRLNPNIDHGTIGQDHLELLRDNASVHIMAGPEQALQAISFHICGLDCDSGEEFFNREAIRWAGPQHTHFCSLRPQH